MKALQQEGPLLITHHGISGPATLRLSAFGARDFHDIKYKGDVTVHWAPELGNTEEIAEALWKMTSLSPKTGRKGARAGCSLSGTPFSHSD